MVVLPAAARKVGNQSRPEKRPFCTGVRRDLAGPAQDARHAEAAFDDRPFALRERRRSAIGPGEEFGAVVGGEHDDGIVVLAHIFELLQHQSDVVIELGHAGFLFRPAILRVARRIPLIREVGHDVHARRVQPAEERLAVRLGLFNELQGEVANFVVHRFHALGIERAGVFNLLFADLAPARHLGRVVHVGRPASGPCCAGRRRSTDFAGSSDAPDLPSRPSDRGSRRTRRSRGRWAGTH